MKAAELADDFVLAHRGGLPTVRPGGAWNSVDDGGGNVQNGGKFSKSSPTRRPAVAGRSGGPRVCNYCRGDGHWKDQCPL